jgi:hypothetical protein
MSLSRSPLAQWRARNLLTWPHSPPMVAGEKPLSRGHVGGELLYEALVPGSGWRLQSTQEPQPTHGSRREVLFYLLGVFRFVVTGLPIRPSLSCCFNVFGPDRSLRLQIQLVNDDEKLTCYSS